MKEYSIEVRELRDGSFGLLNTDEGEIVEFFDDHSAACDRRWSLLREEERQEIIDECEIAESEYWERRANAALSCDHYAGF